MTDAIMTTTQRVTVNIDIRITVARTTKFNPSTSFPASPPTSPLTPPTTPPASFPAMTLEADHDADIWEDDNEGHGTEEMLSDLPSVKRQHMTDGYREGLSTSKAQVMQNGFDEGYPIGLQIAMRVGPILGVLEAYLACKSIDTHPGTRERVQSAYKNALHALEITQLLQTTDEESLLAMKTIPKSAEDILSYWEGMVTSVYELRQVTMKMYDEQNPNALRETVEDAKFKDPAYFDTNDTDKATVSTV